MKTYRGSPAGARTYVESGRARADDYYLAEGTGIADCYAASPAAGVRRLEPLTGDEYEAWVAGIDPATGEPKGRLRHDESAVRFVEVVVNGPKSWSLAAELHPEISAAYDAAQDRASEQIIGWLAQHATTRVGPRGAQVQAPVTELEAAVVRHRTSRAGDPHRHLHLQINARVFAEGRWCGLHTVGVRDSLDAINGIGHAAVMTDPAFRSALAAHGYTLDPRSGEVTQLAEFVGPFSARAAQIARNIDRYEADWRTANPGREPGPRLRQAWDARAWAEQRPDKIVPKNGAELTARWRTELREPGFRAPTQPVLFLASSVGQLDRDHAVGDVLTRLAARRSAWNAADIRGEVEQLIARADVVTSAAVRAELAEDLTARTLAQCLPLLDRVGVPEHLRVLTSAHVLEVESDLVARLAARGNAPMATPVATLSGESQALDVAQQRAVELLSGVARLVVVEGAAGAGKTTTLAAARTAIEREQHRLVVVTPTRKAAQVAAKELDTSASSAAWLLHQHGYRWDGQGGWTRLAPGDVDAVTGGMYTGPNGNARLRRGDVLLCDEAGMLDQDTARALLAIADEHAARVALVGDRHQLPAIGRGGVLDLAVRWAATDAHLTLDTVHRFVRPGSGVADDEYARLSLAMRSGEDPSHVFDALLARGQIRIHSSERQRLRAIADAAGDGTGTVAVADTRDQVATLNAAIRERRIQEGTVDDTRVTISSAGQRIGAGDRIATRRNDRDLDVANRDTWTVQRVHDDGAITATGARGERILPAGYVRKHVELAYASTVHGVQGETVTCAHVVIGEHTAAAGAYVGMTRGREQNIAHLLADTDDDARKQWVAVFARDRADLGPAHAARAAAHEAARYAPHRPLEIALHELHAAWTAEASADSDLTDLQRRRVLLADVVALTREHDRIVSPLKAAYQSALLTAVDLSGRAAGAEAGVSAHAARIADGLRREWERERPAAARAGYVVLDGIGRLGQRLWQVRRAAEELARWSVRWQLYLPDMPTRTERVAHFATFPRDPSRILDAFARHARQVAEQANPGYRPAQEHAAAAISRRDQAWRAYRDAQDRFNLSGYGALAHLDNPAGRLAEVDRDIAAARGRLDSAREQIAGLRTEPVLRSQPVEVLELARADWQADRDHAAALRQLRWAAQADRERDAIGPRGAGRGAVLEIRPDAPGRSISR